MLDHLKTAGHPVRFLASVTSVAEAEICVAAGADVIDCKDPSRGALGALALDTVRAIRAAVPKSIPVSATIGDLPSDPMPVVWAVEAVAARGVDVVKIGVFPEGDPETMIARAGAARLAGARLVGVLLVDLDPDWTLISRMAQAGFAGVMLDTADKIAPWACSDFMRDVEKFIARARAAGLFAGLAGSLRLGQIPKLIDAGPDILGFRSALCHEGRRLAEIDPERVAAVRKAIAANVVHPEQVRAHGA